MAGHMQEVYMTVNGVQFDTQAGRYLLSYGQDKWLRSWRGGNEPGTDMGPDYMAVGSVNFPDHPLKLAQVFRSDGQGLAVVSCENRRVYTVPVALNGHLDPPQEILRSQQYRPLLNITDLMVVKAPSSQDSTVAERTQWLVTAHENNPAAEQPGAVRIWDLSHDAYVHQFRFPDRPVYCIDYDPTSQLLVTATGPRHGNAPQTTIPLYESDPWARLHLLDARDGARQDGQAINTPSKEINLSEFSPCGRYIAAGCIEDTCLIYDCRFTREPVATLRHPRPPSSSSQTGVYSVHWYNSNHIVTGGPDSKVKVWDIGRGSPLLYELDLAGGSIEMIEVYGKFLLPRYDLRVGWVK
ncbi:hypothetical protein IWQ60_007650 [Tieghemiomyces parasiticus]|uniref:Uncharacterized protein n=1 Tax=Tieghemiomyces parasiticus TaxID=78921 RepID=A0A9W8DTP7_9FUNG|nr:hypothetical protein IWQ60_007650 [Tieghemiomyces parasiticus]